MIERNDALRIDPVKADRFVDLNDVNMGYLKDMLYPALRVLEGQFKLPLMELRVDFFEDAIYVGGVDKTDALLVTRKELESGLTLKELGSREEGRLRKFCASYAEEHIS